MSRTYRCRGRNWYTAMGSMFLVMAAIVMTRQLFLFGPEFVLDFLLNAEFTNEKVSMVMVGIGGVLVTKGLAIGNDDGPVS